MEKVYKYPLVIADRQTLLMPIGAMPLTVALQGGSPCLWAQVKYGVATEERVVRIIGTGRDIPDALKLSYVGALHGDGFVWHVYMQDVH